MEHTSIENSIIKTIILLKIKVLSSCSRILYSVFNHFKKLSKVYCV
uniref:Uncharacterized protein n=1 Tax=Amphimedon queenslandica TaxID=400682 RepID=A0A1X7TNC2_AMPQE